MTPLSHYPIHGDLLRNRDGCFFDVIGFDHPIDRVIAYIRYFPIHTKSDRILKLENTEQYFSKVYNLKDREKYLTQQYSHYIFHPNNYDFALQGIPIQEIESHYRPEQFLGTCISKFKHKEKLTKSAALSTELCQFLAEQSGIDLEFFGITGSALIGLDNNNSDLDLVVYGKMNSLRVRDTIRKCFQESSDSKKPNVLQPYNKLGLKKLYHERKDQSGLSFYDFLKFEARKLQQGTFHSVDFFIRFLEYDHRQEYAKKNAFLLIQTRDLGRIKIQGQVRGDEFWWITPARVEIGNLTVIDKSELKTNTPEICTKYDVNIAQIRNTFSMRGRFIENVRLLEYFEAYGNLELIIPSDGSLYLQISFGRDPRDYLKHI